MYLKCLCNRFKIYTFGMSTGKVVRSGIRYVKPILSTNHQEAKRRVLGLYRAYCREIPMTCNIFLSKKSAIKNDIFQE